MDEIKEKAENLVGHMSDYVETFVDLKMVNATAKITNVASIGLVSLLKGVLILFVFLFLSIALAVWIGNLIANAVAGFLVVAGVYLLLLFIVFLFHKSILPPVRNTLVRKIYES